MYKESTNKLANLIEKLELINPLGVLKRGYSLTYQDDKIVNDIKQVKLGSKLQVKMQNGNVEATVEKINEGEF